MSITVHEGAARRAEELALRVLDRLSPDPPAERTPRSNYQPVFHVKHAITSSDIVGPLVRAERDRFGRETSRYYSDDRGTLGISGADYEEFLKATRTLHRQPTVREFVSERTVSELVFEWLCQTKRDGSNQPMVAAVLGRIEALIADFRVLIPIYGLHVEVPFDVGNVTFRDITEQQMADWRAMVIRRAPERAAQIDKLHDRLSRLYLGKAAALFTTRAEGQHAVARAREETELSVAALRLYSIGAFFPERASAFALAGSEVVARGTELVLEIPDTFTSRESILHPLDTEPWVLDKETITHTLPPLIGHWSELLKKPRLAAFEADALRSVILYSRATSYRNISEKLIHILSAVESLLLRNDTEPIVVSVADRLAFAVGHSGDDRLRINRNLRDVYALRSKYVHHALEPTADGPDLAILEAFLVNVSQFFINLRFAMQAYASREAFIDALERRKYE